MTREVMPLVDGSYRTLPGRPNSGIGGSSYGGVAALYAMIGLIRQVEANFRFVVDPEAVHTEAAWEKRLPGALAFLFGDWKPTPPPQP